MPPSMVGSQMDRAFQLAVPLEPLEVGEKQLLKGKFDAVIEKESHSWTKRGKSRPLPRATQSESSGQELVFWH